MSDRSLIELTSDNLLEIERVRTAAQALAESTAPLLAALIEQTASFLGTTLTLQPGRVAQPDFDHAGTISDPTVFFPVTNEGKSVAEFWVRIESSYRPEAGKRIVMLWREKGFDALLLYAVRENEDPTPHHARCLADGSLNFMRASAPAPAPTIPPKRRGLLQRLLFGARPA